MALIDRYAAIDALTDTELRRNLDSVYDGDMNRTRRAAQRVIAQVPVVDAVPVVHAQWDGYNADYSDWLRNDGKPIFISCCVCNNVVLNNGSASWNYCPNCGAKMDGERSDSE